jgi:hypothetical protein
MDAEGRHRQARTVKLRFEDSLTRFSNQATMPESYR